MFLSFFFAAVSNLIPRQVEVGLIKLMKICFDPVCFKTAVWCSSAPYQTGLPHIITTLKCNREKDNRILDQNIALWKEGKDALQGSSRLELQTGELQIAETQVKSCCVLVMRTQQKVFSRRLFLLEWWQTTTEAVYSLICTLVQMKLKQTKQKLLSSSFGKHTRPQSSLTRRIRFKSS